MTEITKPQSETINSISICRKNPISKMNKNRKKDIMSPRPDEVDNGFDELRMKQYQLIFVNRKKKIYIHNMRNLMKKIYLRRFVSIFWNINFFSIFLLSVLNCIFIASPVNYCDIIIFDLELINQLMQKYHRPPQNRAPK